MSLEKELALIYMEYACSAIPKFRGQKEEFTCWLSKVERVFACCNLNDQEKFKVVISRLRGCAFEWWNNYKFKRRSKGKEKVRTWKKLSSKLKGAFSPSTYMPMKESISIKPTTSFPSTPQKNQAPQDSLPSQSQPETLSKSIPRCSKCQGFGHFASDCPNQKIVTLAEYQASFEELEEEGRREEKEVCLNEPMEEVEEGPDEGELLVIREFDHKEITLTPLKTPTPSKPKDQPLLSVFLTNPLKSQMHEYGPYKEWILLNQEPSQPTASRHPLLTPLLQDFQHVFPQVIPRELPHVQDGFLSKGSQLYITKCGVRELFISEVQGGALTSPFGEQKMTSMLKEHYYRPTLSRDVEYYIKGLKRKSKVQSIPDENEDIPSLRTNSHQPGEYDVYLLGDYTQPFSSNPFELASFQIQARQDLFSSPWFEFKGKRHFMEFYLNFKMPTLKRSSKNGEQAF